MLNWQKDNTVPYAKARQMTPEQLQGKIVTGIFNDDRFPEYTERYQQIIEKAEVK